MLWYAKGDPGTLLIFVPMEVNCTRVPDGATKFRGSLVGQYLSRDEAIKPFYNHFPDLAGYHAALKEAQSFSFPRQELVNALTQQNEKAPIGVKEKINLLKKDDVYTVCTGHQLQILTGPLFFIYKIVTTLSLAKELTRELGVTLLPVFWLASEDHDKAEVTDVHFSNQQKIIADLTGSGPVGRMMLSESRKLTESLFRNIPSADWGKAVQEICKDGRSLTTITRELVYEIFGEDSPIILDADSTELKKLLVPAMHKEFKESCTAVEVGKTISTFTDSGMPASAIQATPRDTGYFYMEDAFRERILKADGKFIAGEFSWSLAELLKESADHPQKFSPDALNRPLYQQILLPNLGYIGGPGELAYWLELKSLFDAHKVFLPVIHPRNHFFLAAENHSKRMQRAGLVPQDILAGLDEIFTRKVKADYGESISLETEKRSLKSLFEAAKDKAGQVDPTLSASAAAHLHKASRQMDVLEKKLLRAARKKEQVLKKDIEVLFDYFYPSGVPQERRWNYFEFRFAFGRELWQVIASCTDPFSPDPVFVFPEASK